jgi:hypothetical protein
MALDKEFLSCQVAVCVGEGGVDDDAAHLNLSRATIESARCSSVGHRPGHAPCRARSADSRGNALGGTTFDRRDRARSGQVVNSQLGLFLYPSAS